MSQQIFMEIKARCLDKHKKAMYNTFRQVAVQDVRLLIFSLGASLPVINASVFIVSASQLVKCEFFIVSASQLVKCELKVIIIIADGFVRFCFGIGDIL